MLEIKKVLNAQEWDNFFSSQKYCIYSQSYCWNEALAEIYNLEFMPLGAYENNQLISVFPILLDKVKKEMHSSYLDQIGINNDNWQLFKDYLFNIVNKYKIHSIKINSLKPINFESNLKLTKKDGIYLIIDIKNKNYDEISKNFSKMKKRNVKNYKDKYFINKSNDLDFFYTIYLSTMKRRKARKIFSKRHFEIILNKCKPYLMCEDYLLENEKIKAGFSFNIVFNKILSSYFLISNFIFFKKRISDIIYYHTIKKAIDLKLDIVNLGPSAKGDGAYEMKKGFGAKDYPVYYYVVYFNNYDYSCGIIKNFLIKKLSKLYYKLK